MGRTHLAVYPNQRVVGHAPLDIVGLLTLGLCDGLGLDLEALVRHGENEDAMQML